ncbi:MAG: PD40 domain-containing protein [Actinobacteria bacterium]|nr:PD40 domain-containing protein [Actinomycetota bacterium]
MRRKLERLDVPGEHEARERAWALVQAAYAERQPQPRGRPTLRLVLVAAAVAALVAAALSPAGRAVLDGVREAVGVESASESLFEVPSGGRLLVTADSGVWVVAADGSKRRLGDYESASWSPFGRFVAASRPNELAALEPDGDVRWKLARRGVRTPVWAGTRSDTRIAYVTDGRLHVVGGDGRRDVEAGGSTSPALLVPPAWRPGSAFEIAYLDTRGYITVLGTERPGLNWRSIRLRDARALLWSPRGDRLLVVGRDRLVWLRASDGVARVERLPGVASVAFAPDGRLAVVRRNGARSDVLVDGRVRFSGTGTFADPTWSPDGRWVLVSWPNADQWLFVRAAGPRRVRAVANVSRQFDSAAPPRIAGWISP